jgi:hypothetical protein
MVQHYQYLLGVLWMLVNINYSSKKTQPYMSKAIIIGYQVRPCPGCSGLMISLGQQPYNGPFYIVNNNPADLGISRQSRFPMYLNIDWETDVSMGCNKRHIYITRFSHV